MQARLQNSLALEKYQDFSYEILVDMLNKRFETVDFEQAKQDVFPFITDKSKLSLWSSEFFSDITKALKCM